MKKPTSIKIFGQKYHIKYDLDSEDAYGLTHQDTNTIQLRPGLPEDKLIRVFMHEVTHAVIFETPLSLRKRFDVEEVCDIVGFHLVDTLKDNPVVLEWIMGEIEG
jgi:ribosome-interacting GTPase 1